MERKKKYTIEVSIGEDNRLRIKRENDGFMAFELLGIIEHTRSEIVQQLAGQIKPETVTRTVVADESLLDRAYRKGKEDRRAEKDKFANPFGPGACSDRWRDGWEDADKGMGQMHEVLEGPDNLSSQRLENARRQGEADAMAGIDDCPWGPKSVPATWWRVGHDTYANFLRTERINGNTVTPEMKKELFGAYAAGREAYDAGTENSGHPYGSGRGDDKLVAYWRMGWEVAKTERGLVEDNSKAICSAVGAIPSGVGRLPEELVACVKGIGARRLEDSHNPHRYDQTGRLAICWQAGWDAMDKAVSAGAAQAAGAVQSEEAAPEDFERQQGRRAFSEGRYLETNPYDERDSKRQIAWTNGWLAASSEARQAEPRIAPEAHEDEEEMFKKILKEFRPWANFKRKENVAQYANGLSARFAGVGRSLNPWDGPQIEWEAWNAGWDYGDRLREASKEGEECSNAKGLQGASAAGNPYNEPYMREAWEIGFNRRKMDGAQADGAMRMLFESLANKASWDSPPKGNGTEPEDQQKTLPWEEGYRARLAASGKADPTKVGAHREGYVAFVRNAAKSPENPFDDTTDTDRFDAWNGGWMTASRFMEKDRALLGEGDEERITALGVDGYLNEAANPYDIEAQPYRWCLWEKGAETASKRYETYRGIAFNKGAEDKQNGIFFNPFKDPGQQKAWEEGHASVQEEEGEKDDA